MNRDAHADYYSELGRLSYSPGWARPEPSMWPEPKPKFRPASWRYAEARAKLDAAGEFVPVEMAERRNLIMVNPIEGNVYATTRNLVAAYQMVKSGESARSHRHTPAALRLVLEAKPGTYTIVDGARVDMAPGDVVLTPSWCWHGHVNEADTTSYWIDFLDVPFVHHAEAMFYEMHPQGLEQVTSNSPSPLRIPSAAALGPGREAKTVEVGKGIIPTIGLHLIRQPAGGRVAMPKSTTNHIYAMVSGGARIEVEGGLAQDLAPGDIVAVPCWHSHTITALADAVLFRVSDAPLLEKLGLARTAAH